MIIGIQDELLRINSLGLLDRLLADKTTKANILWATDAYTDLGPGYQRDREIRAELITGEHSGVIKNRARKALEQQSARTRQHAEVFTPHWVCAKMCDYADEVWFGRPGAFFKDDEPTDQVEFPKRKSWKRYVDDRRMEITCGEAPFLVSRYDVSTGETIPLERRTGLLDRKLRVVSENTDTEEDWLQWALRAFQATWGYEFQGDNLLIARLNVLMTFEEYLSSRWKRKPTKQEYETITDVIVWNLWQMDGLTYTIPYRKPEEEGFQFDFFEDMGFPAEEEKTQPYCRIYDWRKKTSFEFQELRREKQKMKFNFIIGNPPYQEEVESENKTFAPAVYHRFLDGAYELADKVEMIHPARFLYNAGNTPKEWNTKMLADPHLKIIFHEHNSSNIFPNTDIMGGIVVTYHDKKQLFGAIQAYVAFDELNSLFHKVSRMTDRRLSEVMYNQSRFDLEALYADHPELKKVIGSNGRDKRFRNNIFEKVNIFTAEQAKTTDVPILGLAGNKRVWKYIARKYLDIQHENFNKYKVLVPAANGSGAIGEIIPTPLIGEPLVVDQFVGYTQSFIGIGAFNDKSGAEDGLKYIKTKFARVMLGILKITQHNPIDTWKYVPLQDFTPASDIDWSKSIPEIDQQLYAKYGLDEKEIEFIESHVKEMS